METTVETTIDTVINTSMENSLNMNAVYVGILMIVIGLTCLIMSFVQKMYKIELRVFSAVLTIDGIAVTTSAFLLPNKTSSILMIGVGFVIAAVFFCMFKNQLSCNIPMKAILTDISLIPGSFMDKYGIFAYQIGDEIYEIKTTIPYKSKTYKVGEEYDILINKENTSGITHKTYYVFTLAIAALIFIVFGTKLLFK